jgi:hypothetical protein
MKFDDGIDLSQSTQTLDRPRRREAAFSHSNGFGSAQNFTEIAEQK